MKILEIVLTAKDFIKLYESAEWEKNVTTNFNHPTIL